MTTGRSDDPLYYDRFRWLRFPGSMRLLPATPEAPSASISLVPSQPIKVETYEPMMETDLVLKFSRINNANDALAFADRYGFLGLLGERECALHMGFKGVHGICGKEPVWFTGPYPDALAGGTAEYQHEPVSLWLEEASEMDVLLYLSEAIDAGKTEDLRSWESDLSIIVIGTLNRDPPFVDHHLFDDVREHIRGLKGRVPRNVLELAKVWLAQRLNSHLQPLNSATFVCLDSVGNLKLHSRPINLRAALWMQLAEIVTKTKKIRRCEICEQLMDVTNHTEAKRVHDRCSLRERMRRYRRARNGKETRKR
jgi:hypothetical protein